MAAKKSSKQVALDELSATVARLEKTVAKLEKRLDKQKDETKKVADAAKKAAKQVAGEIEKVARRAEKQVRKTEKKLRRSAPAEQPDTEQSAAGQSDTVAMGVDGAVDGIAADVLVHEPAEVTLPTTPIKDQEPDPESMAAPTPSGTTMDPDWSIEKLSLAQLRALARERGLTGYSRKTKQQLLAELS